MTWTLIDNIRGPAGPPGPPGPPGETYAHRQDVPAATWSVSHTLGGCPDVVLLLDDAPAERVFTDVSYPDDHTVTIEWPTAVAGWAYLG